MGFPAKAGLSELADEADSKSVDGNIVWVQVPWPALKSAIHLSGCVAFWILRADAEEWIKIKYENGMRFGKI